MSRFAEVAKNNQKAGCPQMEDREPEAPEHPGGLQSRSHQSVFKMS